MGPFFVSQFILNMTKIIFKNEKDNQLNALRVIALCLNQPNKINMQEHINKPASRKRFLQWGSAILGSITIFKFLPKTKKPAPETIKFLTEDGKLVEVDYKLLASTGKKISDKELQQWIKK